MKPGDLISLKPEYQGLRPPTVFLVVHQDQSLVVVLHPKDVVMNINLDTLGRRYEVLSEAG